MKSADKTTYIFTVEPVIINGQLHYRHPELGVYGPNDVKSTPRSCCFCGSKEAHAWYTRPVLDGEGKLLYSQMVYKCNQIDIVGGKPWSFLDMETGVKVHVG